MKRIILMILMTLFIASPAFALDNNVVYIYEADGKIYYDTTRLDGRFMSHEGMVPGGEVYTDELMVENGTSKDYDVYFQITTDHRGDQAEDLLNHIEMTIWLGDDATPMYEGKATGRKYYDEGVNLADAVLLKHFAAGESVKMRVQTYLDKTYEDIYNPNVSTTKWHFYIADEPEPQPEPEPEPEPTPIEPIEVLPNPRTNDDFTPVYFVILGISIVTFIFISVRERAGKKDED